MDRLKPVKLNPLRVAVLLGGDSAEREISLQSGSAVAEAISGQGHSVVSIDPAETNLEAVDWSGIDIAFLALHGTFGEDGGVQEILESCGVPFTGSNSAASRLAFRKADAKQRFAEHGVPTPDASFFTRSDLPGELELRATSLGLPVVVKPDAQGSSIGVTIVRDILQLDKAVQQCLAVSDTGLIEKMVEGSEWTIGVIDEDSLPLIHIRTDRGFFDFTAKYEDDRTGYEFDSEIDDATRSRIESAGLAACRALGTSGIARADVMLDSIGNPWVLEVNTIPGMTDHSLVPKAAAKIGLSLGQLCDIVLSRTLAQDEQRRLRDAS